MRFLRKPEPIIKNPAILERLASLDLKDDNAITTYVEDVHQELLKEYKKADRTLFHKKVKQEEAAGFVLTSGIIDKLNTVFNRFYDLYPDRDSPKFILGLYKMNVEEICINELFANNAELCTYFTNKKILPFGNNLHKRSHAILIVTDKSDVVKINMLSTLNNDMKMLLSLLEQIATLRTHYSEQTGWSAISAERENVTSLNSKPSCKYTLKKLNQAQPHSQNNGFLRYGKRLKKSQAVFTISNELTPWAEPTTHRVMSVCFPKYSVKQFWKIAL
jgi:hypothetical protein